MTARFRIDPDIKGKLDGQLKRAGLAATRLSSRNFAPANIRDLGCKACSYSAVGARARLPPSAGMTTVSPSSAVAAARSP